jgi:flagellar motor switch protein FliN/FliY
MTIESDGSLLTSLEFFETFGNRYREGIANRVEDPIEADGPEITPGSRAAVAGGEPGGALLARTAWGGEGAERVGCLLWSGDLPFLIGGEDREAGMLSPADVETLEAHLRLNVEEGGDGPLPVDWTSVRAFPADELDDAMRRAGIAEECEVATLELKTGERRISFRFLVATEEPEPEPVEAEGDGMTEEGAEAEGAITEETVAGLDVLDEAAELGLTDAGDGGAGGDAPSTGGPAALPAPGELQNLQHLLDVRMPLTIRLGSTRMNLDRLLRVAPGAILELDQREETPLEVLANGHVIARGEVVVMDERFGLRITEIGGAEERLRATL